MPPGVDPILFFRTIAKNLPMTAAMGTWADYELSRDLSLSFRGSRDPDRSDLRALRM